MNLLMNTELLWKILARSFLMTCIAVGSSVQAQQEIGHSTPAAFVYIDQDERERYRSLHSEHLTAVEEDSPIFDIQFVRVALETLATGNPVNLNLLLNADIVLDMVRIESTTSDGEGWRWVGSSSNSEHSFDKMTLTVSGPNAYGSVRRSSDLYRIQPFDGMVHLLIRVDESRLPSDHEPDYEQSLDQPVDHDTQIPTHPAEDCSSYKVILAYTEKAGDEMFRQYAPSYPTLNKDALIRQIFRETIGETNDSYLDSGVKLKAELVHVFEATGYVEEPTMKDDLQHFCTPNDHILDEVHSLRNSHRADVAVLITKKRPHSCGRAAKIGANASTAFAVVARDCLAATGAYTFGHEIGHLQGARHNPGADPRNWPFAYGHGYLPADIRERKWRTIMAYSRWDGAYQCNPDYGCPRLNRWSDPHANPSMGTIGLHNNTRVLKETACKIAGWR